VAQVGSRTAGRQPDDDLPLPRSGATTQRPLGRGSKIFLSLCALVLITGTTASLAYSTIELSYRTGLVGSPGTLTGVRCAVHGSHTSPRYDCVGHFAADDRSAVLSVATIEGDDIDWSTRMIDDFSARLHPDGRTVSVVDRKGVADMLGHLLTSLGLLVGVVFVTVVGVFASRGVDRYGNWSMRWWVWAPPTVLAVTLFALGLALPVF
jgi:hypothetical protein